MIDIDHIHKTDVLIIGGGGAAMRAAVAAADTGAHTTVVIKGTRKSGGATVSQNSDGVAWQAADSSSSVDDGPEIHCENIIDAGLGMADPKLAKILSEEVLERGEELESWGMNFVPDPEGEKKYYTGYGCFGNRPRAHGIRNSGYGHAGDIIRALIPQIASRDIVTHESTFISDLLVADGRCVGAIGLNANSEVVVYQAGAVVLVAGGARQLFPREAGRDLIDTTGDGYAMALRAGATLANMEFMQYMLHPEHPFPVKVPGVYWSLFPTVRNQAGDDLLDTVLPPGISQEEVFIDKTLHYPFTFRDTSRYLDLAVSDALRAIEDPANEAVYMDFSQVDLNHFTPSRPLHLPEDMTAPVELPDRWVKIHHVAHAINGGVLIDEQASTSLPGLYAAGEVAAGPHGADRLGGGMVSNCQVFGNRAGRFAGEFSKSTSGDLSHSSLEGPLRRLKRSGKQQRTADDLLSVLQTSMMNNYMVTKSQVGLEQLMSEVSSLKEDLQNLSIDVDYHSRRKAIEFENLLLTAETMTKAAIMRKESRGSHCREDHPNQDDINWNKSILFEMEGNTLRAHTRDLAAVEE